MERSGFIDMKCRPTTHWSKPLPRRINEMAYLAWLLRSMWLGSFRVNKDGNTDLHSNRKQTFNKPEWIAG
jgi:hypothetical protein